MWVMDVTYMLNIAENSQSEYANLTVFSESGEIVGYKIDGDKVILISKKLTLDESLELSSKLEKQELQTLADDD